jgi:leucyl aminopeptidase
VAQIARIQGAKAVEDESLVIIGAHLDSINLSDPSLTARAPGADDDGSGTTTLLETFHVLAEAGYLPDRTVELHWYAAEEPGIFGSQDVANKYEEDDMTAWVKNGTDEGEGSGCPTKSEGHA